MNNKNDKKLNCWEFHKCGRIPGGANEKTLKICNAYYMKLLDGINDGLNGGRTCWACSGTLCKGYIDGVLCKKIDCTDCEFFELVKEEEDKNYKDTKYILDEIRKYFNKK